MSWTPIKLIESNPGSFELFRQLDESISGSMTRQKLERSRWKLVRCGGNMSADTPMGGYETREAAVEVAQKHAPGVFALWLQHGERLHEGSWEELTLEKSAEGLNNPESPS